MNELFAKCVPFDSALKGRIGGNPPKLIEDQLPNEFQFYATLVHPEKENTMLSILVHKDFKTRIENSIYPSIAVNIIEHEYSETGTNMSKAMPELGVNSISEYNNTPDDRLFVKAGGEPRFIQYKDHYYKKLQEDNYSFFLQIDEEGYSNGLAKTYIFSFGALYLYKHNETGKIIAGFWQFS